MPLTTGFTTRLAIKGEGHIHTDKWHRCIEHVKANSPGVEPHAVCTNSIGYHGSINPEHQTEGRHASANPKRFKTKEGQRSARARERQAKEASKMDTSYADVLKFRVSKAHMCWGHECGGGGGKQMLPHGKVSEAHAKELGLEPGSYTNKPGVGVMGMSHADAAKAPAHAASVNADVKSNAIARDKKKNASHIEHDQAARSHSTAAKEHAKLGNTAETAHHNEKAKYHREQSKRIKG